MSKLIASTFRVANTNISMEVQALPKESGAEMYMRIRKQLEQNLSTKTVPLFQHEIKE